MANVILKSDAQKRLKRKYGENFPGIDPKITGEKWQAWFKEKREEQSEAMKDRRLHWSRHRNMRAGIQWIATRDGKTWKEPTADKNTIRIVDNHIGPALDFRHGIIAEQKPGFRHDLLSATIAAREKAEAQQAVAEFYFHKLKAEKVFKDALWNAQTDGVCFVQVWFDPLAGKYMQNVVQVPETDPRYKGLIAQGYQLDEASGMVLIPLSESGEQQKAGAEIGMVAEGDLACRVVMAQDTLADPEARQLNGAGSDSAKWFLVRRPRELAAARIETGNDALEAEIYDGEANPTDFPSEGYGFQRGLPPFPGCKKKYKELVYDYTIFIAPDGQDLEQGLWRRVIGDTVVDTGDELPGGVIPFARFADGSPDPSLYPRPMMSDWVGDQISINALQSLIMQHGRILGIGRLLSLKGTTLSESYNAVIGSLLEYEGIKPEHMPAGKVSADLWDLLQFKIKKLEDKSGFNDLARGQVLGQSGGGMQDVSGRAVLGAREMLERTFGPMVQAGAEGASEWAEIIVKYAAWMFGDTPRQIENVGGRGDLAMQVSRKEIEGECVVYCDAATLMPMPAQLRQEQLDSFRKEGLISVATWAKRSPYAETRSVQMGDLDHWQRAQWVNSVLEENWEEYAMPPEQSQAPAVPGALPAAPAASNVAALYGPSGLPVWWQDDPAAHLTALNEIILDERKPFELRKLASDRAGIYEQLAQAKADPMQPVPVEVIGVPLNRLLAAAAAMPPGITVPTPQGQPAVVSPGESAPGPGADTGSQMSDAPAPLGTVGAIEQGMRQ